MCFYGMQQPLLTQESGELGIEEFTVYTGIRDTAFMICEKSVYSGYS